MKRVYNFQKVANRFDHGHQIVCTPSLVVRVIAIKRHPHKENDPIQVTFLLSQGNRYIGSLEIEYASILDVLKAFDIDELTEIWEVW